MFMVVVIKGKQYKLTMDDVVISESMGPDIDVNETVRMEGVMLVGSKDWTVVGTPQVSTAALPPCVHPGVEGLWSAPPVWSACSVCHGCTTTDDMSWHTTGSQRLN